MIKNEEYFNASKPAGFDGVFNWDFITFRGNIKPMDIDAIVERRGHFLVFETKRLDNTEIPRGQKITLSRLHDSMKVTIIVLHGKCENDITKIYAYPEKGKGMRIDFKDGKQSVQMLVDAWQAYANGEINDLHSEFLKISNL